MQKTTKSERRANIKRPASITTEQAAAITERLYGHHRTIWRLSCETGARISDILRLTVSEVRKNPLTIYESKSRRSRTITLSNELHQHLRSAYGWGRGDYPAFCGSVSVDRAMHRTTYHRALKQAASALKINVSAHSARKLYAQRIYRDTNDITAVQEALHHQKPSTTLTYLDKRIITPL